MAVQFKATVYEHGINPRVDVPEEISRAFGDKGYVAVRGTMNGVGIRATMVPAGGGRHVLHLNTQMRLRAGVNVGDNVEFSLDRGESLRKPPMSAELGLKLETNPEAKAAWAAWAPARRRRTLRYMSWLRSPDAISRNVEKVLRLLREGR
jgi:uncharacterized protein DUF1905